MPLHSTLVAPNPLLEPLASAICALIGIGRDPMGFEAHALPQVDRAVGPELAVLLLDPHMPRRLAPHELLDRVHYAFLNVTA
jgi:hypothetical protein